MGTDITQKFFSKENFETFQHKLRQETALLSEWFEQKNFEDETYSLGLELETCLVDQDFLPAPENEKFLKQINHPLVVPELSKFNAELNTSPQVVSPFCLRMIYNDLKKLWQEVQKNSEALGLKMLMIGCLPTLKDEMLTLEFMSDRDRYRALNEQVLSLRKKRKAHISIEGVEKIELQHNDVMLEAAATSMQIHLQVPFSKINSFFNASIVCSAPLVALSANAPFLFGKNLWEESRIPVFEEAVHLPAFFDLNGFLVQRVSFGSDYIRHSLLEYFLENLQAYPALLPICEESAREKLTHLRLHNGTIWRWNRPILGIEKGKKNHLRIEQRVCSAGPTCIDIVANIAFFMGLTQTLAKDLSENKNKLSFEAARKNFYQAAKFGLSASIEWLDGKTHSLQKLILNELLPQAELGLKQLNVDSFEIHYWLREIMYERIKCGQNAAFWQRAFVNTHGKDFQELCKNYFDFQEQDLPIHLWKVC